MAYHFVLAHEQARQRAATACYDAPANWVVDIKPPKQSRDQQALYHVIFDEFADQARFMDKQWDSEAWKRLLIDAYARHRASEGRPLAGHGLIVPSLDGGGWVQLGVQSRDFRKEEASEFIEMLHATADEYNVRLNKTTSR